MSTPKTPDTLSTSGWTVDTLHEHVMKLMALKEERDAERFKAQNEMNGLALAAADRAVTKAENAAEKRFEGVNEFRNTLADQQRTLMPRTEVELALNALKDDVRLLKEQGLKSAGQGVGLSQAWMLILGVLTLASLVLGILAFFKT